MDYGVFVIDILNGISRGMFYFLMSSGLALTFSVLGIINFAHGSFIMLGAYFAWTLLQMVSGGIAFILVLFISGILVGLVGMVVEVLFLRKIYNNNELYQLLMTFAFVMIIDGIILEVWGGQPLVIPLPDFLLGGVSILGRFFPIYSIFTLISSIIVAIILWMVLQKTNFGKASRASASDPEITTTLGIDINIVFTGMFSLGIVLAGFSGGIGLAMSPLIPGSGGGLAILCFAAIVIGGMGSLKGTLVAAMILGVFEAFGDHYFPQISMALPYIIMAVILLIKPQGLFGKAE